MHFVLISTLVIFVTRRIMSYFAVMKGRYDIDSGYTFFNLLVSSQ